MTELLQVGPVLDAWGPRFISVVGCGISVLGLVLFGVSHSGGFDAFVAASLLFSESIGQNQGQCLGQMLGQTSTKLGG